MVLQAHNTMHRLALKKRTVLNENLPPSSTPSLTKHGRLSASIKEVGRRRRARVSSGSDIKPKFSLDKSGRRVRVDSNARALYTNVPSRSSNTLQGDTQDGAIKSTFTLPKHLPRPDHTGIRDDALAAIDLGLVDTPLNYIHEALEGLGPDMYKVLAASKVDGAPSVMPKTMPVTINDMSSDMPTHIFAVYTPPSAGVNTCKVKMYPAHHIVFAAHCANLGPLNFTAQVAPEAIGAQINLPVVPLNIPAPDFYPPLASWLYHKRVDELLRSLLPMLPPTPKTPVEYYATEPRTQEEADLKEQMTANFSRVLASIYAPTYLLGYANRLNNFWKNVCALGIYEPRLWSAMDFAWDSLLGAMKLASNTPMVLREVAPTVPMPKPMPTLHRSL